MDKLFQIFKADERDVMTVAQSKNDPHVHDFKELIIGVEGKLEVFLNGFGSWLLLVQLMMLLDLFVNDNKWTNLCG